MISYANAFCIPGAMYIYERLQTLLWWLFQNGIMLYGVVRPLKYRSHSDSGKLKYVHLSFLAAGIGLPLIPVLICHWIGGYGIVVVPNYTCLPKNISATMYCLFLPATVCAIIGLSMLLYIGSKLGIKVIYNIITYTQYTNDASKKGNKCFSLIYIQWKQSTESDIEADVAGAEVKILIIASTFLLLFLLYSYSHKLSVRLES